MSPPFESGVYAYDVVLDNYYSEVKMTYRTRSRAATVWTVTSAFVPTVAPSHTAHLNLPSPPPAPPSAPPAGRRRLLQYLGDESSLAVSLPVGSTEIRWNISAAAPGIWNSYLVRVRRLSPETATRVSTLQLMAGGTGARETVALSPTFSSDVFAYALTAAGARRHEHHRRRHLLARV